jgi:hypothetical protein
LNHDGLCSTTTSCDERSSTQNDFGCAAPSRCADKYLSTSIAQIPVSSSSLPGRHEDISAAFVPLGNTAKKSIPPDDIASMGSAEVKSWLTNWPPRFE